MVAFFCVFIYLVIFTFTLFLSKHKLGRNLSFRLVGFLGIVVSKSQQAKFDLIIYDGISREETLRIIGASSKARLYLKYLRNLDDKIDLVRLAAPSLLRLVDEAMRISSSRSYFNGRMSSEIWDTLDQLLGRGNSAFSNP